MTDTTNTSSTAPQPEFPPDNDGSKVGWVIGIIAVILAITVVIIVSDGIRHWFALHTGVLNGGPDPFYNFWSGIGSDIGEVTLISAVGIGVYTGVRKVNCHSKRCWRIGHHALEGTPYILCRHHHPSVPNLGATHEHILNVHHKHELAKAAEQRGRPSS
jgi:hypothetical protein